ncbi:uncharacterized protein ARMOST_08017 [Armillaria ostoyae]|uniref:Uncharacterized protein n=1 Tax=Armillaria ostoyae TaxID=47428 RepID=A0A284R7J6_ARMOS|nr:uncharacterized protein ARMOST_08017 [Armillaria ostoyae]
MIAVRLLALPSHIKVHPSRVEQSARGASYLEGELCKIMNNMQRRKHVFKHSSPLTLPLSTGFDTRTGERMHDLHEASLRFWIWDTKTLPPDPPFSKDVDTDLATVDFKL